MTVKNIVKLLHKTYGYFTNLTDLYDFYFHDTCPVLLKMTVTDLKYPFKSRKYSCNLFIDI